MSHFVYVLYSVEVDKYYVGETEDFHTRLIQHNTGFFKNSFTSQANDWHKHVLIECANRTQARGIELFIKQMQSRKFLERLKNENELAESLKLKFAEGHSPEDSGRTL